MPTNDEILAQQIGGLGGEQDNLGKLNHIPGTQDNLTETEQSSLDKFKAATSRMHESQFTNDVRDGWIPIDRSSLGIRSMFYPEDWEFRIKPATVEAIKNWSSIDEENLAVINNVMNEIIRTCVSIYSSNGPQRWDKINSWDRFWFICQVRKYTFAHGEQALEFDEECDHCGGNIHYTLEAENLHYEFPDPEVIENHWNQDRMCWEINPKDYGLEGRPVVKLYIPNLQKDTAILNWIYQQQQQNSHSKYLNETFIKFLPYMLERAPKDSTLLDKEIKDCYHTYDRWDTDLFLFMDDVRKNIVINPSEKLTQKCPDCGEEVTSTVRFPNGIKYLFAIQSKHRKFGSK